LASASNYSTIFVGGEVAIAQERLAPNYLFRAEDSTIDLRHASFLGFPLAAGLKASLDRGILFLPEGGVGAIPGAGLEMINSSFCRPSCD
jgi:hypothetical protein